MSLATICLPVQNELKAVEKELVEMTSSNVELVSQAATYVLQNGGKRIRPAMLFLTAKMLGFPLAKAVPVGAAVEMIHAASLMHDDVLDNATLRRGKTSTNAKWGNQISILVGDFLWCKASRAVIGSGDPKILLSITTAVENTIEGEILEMVGRNDFDITEEDHLKIIKLKTAVLFGCACEVGAILAGSSEKMASSLQNYGINLGIAFQLVDDILDYTAIDDRFGKIAGTDMCEGRLTSPVILALKRCTASEATLIKEALLANTLDPSRLCDVRNILARYNTIEASFDMAMKYADLAKRELASFKPSLERDSLAALADYAVSRSR